MKKRLIFSFYATEDFENNIANKFHFKCLEHYSNVFSEVVVCIIVNDTNNHELICKVRNRFLHIFKCNIAFKTYENSVLNESIVFEGEISNKLALLDGLTFFAHNKGVGNMDNEICDKNSILRWILGMYYLNLEDLSDVEDCLCRGLKGLFYGAYLTSHEGIQNKAHMWYAGTFYWLNAQKIHRYCEAKDIVIPKATDRFFDELFPGSICEWGEGTELCSFNSLVIYNKNLYVNSYQSTMFLLGNKCSAFNEMFNTFKKDIYPYNYTVLTYNFGNYDIVHEILHRQNNVQYVCVTDNKDLTSNTWNVVYDEKLEGMSPMEKVYYVRYNCFDYCDTNLCIKVDSSIQIRDTLDSLIHDFEKQDKRIAFLVHPRSKNIEEEYATWLNERNLDPKEKEIMLEYISQSKLDSNFNGLYEVGFMVVKKDYDTIALNKKMLDGIRWFKEHGVNMRVDQVLFSVVMNSGFKYLNVLPLSHSIIQSEKVRWYVHGSDTYFCTIPVNSNDGYCFNKIVNLYNWNE